MIKTTSYDQQEIIKSIMRLYTKGKIDCDPTFSKGVFYKGMDRPKFTFDLYPQDEKTVKSDANCLPLKDASIESIMFDPPFLAGYTKQNPTGIIGSRFHGFRYVKDLWAWYDTCLIEFNRVLKKKGVLVFKCQDTVSSVRQHLSHVFIINKAQEMGFYAKDIFILCAKSRIQGHNHAKQKHARKFHSYFIVFEKVT